MVGSTKCQQKMAEDQVDEKSDILLTERKLLSALNNLPPMPDLSKHFSTRNAKIIAALCVVGFVIYHSILLATLGSDSCQWLLSDGRFQGSQWQPFGCMMHTYGRGDARSCMHYIYYWKGRNTVVFMGDERMMSLYTEFVSLIDGDGSPDVEDVPIPLERKSLMYTNSTNIASNYENSLNQHYEQNAIGLYVEFQHYPFLNDDFRDKLKEYHKMEVNHRPSTIVTGLSLCKLKPMEIDNNTRAKWNSDLREAAKILEQIHSSDLDIVWNLQDPLPSPKDDKDNNETKAINKVIDSHNRVALEMFESSSVRLWKSSRLIAQIFQKNSSSLNESQHSQIDTQILLNYRCNGNMYYQDGTCCTTTEKPTLLQFLSAIIFVMCMSLTIVMFCACRRDVREAKTTAIPEGEVKVEGSVPRSKQPSWKVTTYEIMKGFSRLSLIVAYAYLCDRTTFFMKENKSYTHLNFLFPLGYVMLIGLFWAKDSNHTTILHRDQTDEWKGWMQLVILVYHFTGASQVLPVYMFIRCLVTAYIFLSAYGNFMYSWNTGDYSVHRYCTVIVRYNLLVICLCMVMNRPYQFYYFVPLITFWYTVMFLTAALWPRANHKTIDEHFKRLYYLIGKLAILATLITLLYNYPDIFEKIFSVNPLKPLFITRDNTIHEWQFRWTLDRYSSLFGVMFALFVILAHKYEILHDKDNESSLFSNDAVFWITGFLSAASFVGYIIMIVMCRTKEQCNNIHSYISFFPILGYIFIRNLAGPIRTLYSPFFAWFGKFALELFVAQYHIWLAADTIGILVLVPNYPVLNVVITTFIFVCAAHELHAATAKLTTYLVPNNWMGLARNSFIFCSLMVPVAIYSGAFEI